MKKLLLLAMIFVVLSSLAHAGGSGLGFTNPKGGVTITRLDTGGNLFSILFSISGLRTSYNAGDRVDITTSQSLFQDCSGSAYFVAEVYNQDKNNQRLDTLVASQSQFLDNNIKAESPLAVRTAGFSFDIPSNVPSRIWSISTYIYCPSIQGNARLYSTVNERDFNVIGALGAGTTTTVPQAVSSKIELLSFSIPKTQLNVGESQSVTATFRAKEAGTYVLESFWQSTNEQFSIFSVVPINVNRCDILDNVAENPQFRNEKVAFNAGEEKTVSFNFPAHTFAGNFIAFVDVTSDCRIDPPDLMANVRVSGYKVVLQGQGLPGLRGDECTLQIGSACSPSDIAGLDDSGPSDQCASGWCQDITGLLGTEDFTTIGGRCTEVGTLSNGKKLSGAEPHRTCVLLGTADTGFDFSFFTDELGPLPVWAWIGIGIFGLLILSRLGGGKS